MLKIPCFPHLVQCMLSLQKAKPSPMLFIREVVSLVIYIVYFLLNRIYISDEELSLPQGVYLYLGYSQKDEALLKKVTNQGALEAIGAIQGLVSYHNTNSNKVHLS